MSKKLNVMKSLLLKVFLLIVILVLGYLVYNSIMQPVEFNKLKAQREAAVVQNLKDIRNSQVLFRQANGAFASNFDTLISYIRNGEIPVVKIIPDPADTTFTKTISDTLGYVSVLDSLFKARRSFSLDELRIIPFSDNKDFELDAGEIERGGVKVSVFEAKAHYKTYLQSLDEQRVLNLAASMEQLERYPGLRVGSMTEPSTDGNWE
jgi:hypothetical protein